jgi:uncharacterized peroxidase-related enzyme
MKSNFISYDVGNAKQESKPLLQSLQDAFGFIPDVFAKMAESPAALKSYLDTNSNLAASQFDDQQKNMIMLAVSVINQCKFCTAAHRMMSIQCGVDASVVNSVLQRDFSSAKGFSTILLAVSDLMESRGALTDEQLSRHMELGMSQQGLIELILIISLKTLSNYTNKLAGSVPNPQLTL